MVPRDVSSELKQKQKSLDELESSLDLMSKKPSKNYIFTESKN